MNVKNSPVSLSEYRDLSLSQLQESPHNPRKRYSESSLKELAESIKAQGVLAPLLVRQLETDRYEIIAGSRRFRAAQLAGGETVPVRVVSLNDAEAQIAMAIENLQREDIHPLEEARAFVNLTEQGMDTATIAGKVGKPPAFVAQRMRLISLIPPIADAFLEDKIAVGHALLIAKLPPAQQPEAFTAAFRSVYLLNGQTSVLVPVRELAGWIESNVMLDLDRAPFEKTDPALLPEAGSCIECPKQTGFNTLLFPDAQGFRCTDRDCWSAKVDRHIARSLERNPALVQISGSWGSREGGPLGRNHYVEIETQKNGRRNSMSPAQKKCPHVAQGIVVDGGVRGQSLSICAEPTCTVHHAESQQAREAQEKLRAEQCKQNEARKLELTARSRIVAAIMAKVQTPLKKADLELVGTTLFGYLPNEYRSAWVLERFRREKQPAPKDVLQAATALLRNANETELGRMLVEMTLVEAVHNRYSSDRASGLEKVAKRYLIDTGKIRQAVAAHFAAKPKKRGTASMVTAAKQPQSSVQSHPRKR